MFETKELKLRFVVSDFKSRSLMNLPGEQSMTLPTRGRQKLRPSLDDSAIGISRSTGSRSSRSSVTSQEGYLESMFRKECEVDERINDRYSEGIEEESEGEFDNPRRSAQVYDENATGSGSETNSSESETETSESEEDIELPKVKLKSSTADVTVNVAVDHEGADFDFMDGDPHCHSRSEGEASDVRNPGSSVAGSNPTNDTSSDVFNPSASPSEYTSELDRVIARENSRSKSDALNSQGTSDGHTSNHTSSSSLSYDGKSAAQRAYERGSSESMSDSRRKISPQENFSFTSQTSNEDRSPKRRSKLYAKGNGLDLCIHFIRN